MIIFSSQALPGFDNMISDISFIPEIGLPVSAAIVFTGWWQYHSFS
jgi:hypothetical protein